jgi:alpha-beta hydrolase superfamily lysophospholipase
MGKGVEAVRRKLERAGKQVTCRIYDGCRHEILNDTCYAEVAEEIRRFLECVG